MTLHLSSAKMILPIWYTGRVQEMLTGAFSRFKRPPGLGCPALRTLRSTLEFLELSTGSGGNTGTAHSPPLYTCPEGPILERTTLYTWQPEATSPAFSELPVAYTPRRFSQELTRLCPAAGRPVTVVPFLGDLGCQVLPPTPGPSTRLSRPEEHYRQKAFPSRLCGIPTHGLSAG